MADKPPSWLLTMREITGTLETPGSADNPTILAWCAEISRRFPAMAAYCRNYTHDSIPWCGLTMAYVMAKNGIRPVFGASDTQRFLWAAAWAGFGTKLTNPKPGCIMVFTRAGGGHVTLLERIEGDYYVCRGGNQSDAVNVAKYHKDKFTAAVWPGAVPLPVPAPEPKTNYRSLVAGGFYSSNPHDMSVKRSIRANNPGALNYAPWQKTWPGYVGFTQADNSPNANKTTIFETPEHGVAAWWHLMTIYRAAGAKTIAGIINRYGGGQNYAAYVNFVVKQTGFASTHEVRLTGDDDNLLKFAKAMFRHEAGVDTPLSDAQIRYGFNLARNRGKTPAIVAGGGAAAGAGAAAASAGLPWWGVALIVAGVVAVAFIAWAMWKNRTTGDVT